MLLLTGWSQKSHLQVLLWFVYPFPMVCKKKGRDIFSSGSAPVTLYEADIGFVKAVFELHRACFISFLLWCFVVLKQWLLLSNNNSSIPSTTLPCQELSMPTRPSQILQQTTNTQSSLWEKKVSSAVCGVIKTDLILGSLLRTGNGNMKVNYFNCPCVTDTIYYYIWKKKIDFSCTISIAENNNKTRKTRTVFKVVVNDLRILMWKYP